LNHLSTQQAIDLTTWLQAQPRHDPRSPSQLAGAASLDLGGNFTAANIRHVKGIVDKARPNLDEHERRLRALERKVQRLEVEQARRFDGRQFCAEMSSRMVDEALVRAVQSNEIPIGYELVMPQGGDPYLKRSGAPYWKEITVSGKDGHPFKEPVLGEPAPKSMMPGYAVKTDERGIVIEIEYQAWPWDSEHGGNCDALIGKDASLARGEF